LRPREFHLRVTARTDQHNGAHNMDKK
jgi:hypothetical protein